MRFVARIRTCSDMRQIRLSRFGRMLAAGELTELGYDSGGLHGTNL